MYTRILSLQKVRATQSHINAKINVKNTCERNESCKCAEICEEKKNVSVQQPEDVLVQLQ